VPENPNVSMSQEGYVSGRVCGREGLCNWLPSVIVTCNSFLVLNRVWQVAINLVLFQMSDYADTDFVVAGARFLYSSTVSDSRDIAPS
jgi:hypothetical protein